MTDRSNERSKRKVEYDKVYQKQNRAATNEYKKEYMRLYRARKKQERLDAGDVASTSVHNNNGAVNTETKPQAVQACGSQQTQSVPMLETTNTNNEHITSNDLHEEKKNETRFNQMIVAIVDVLTSFDVSTSTIATII